MAKDIKIGEFQKFNYPDHAEQFEFSEFVEESIVKEFSQLFQRGVKKTVNVFYCPKCKKKADVFPEHGDAYKCGNCGMNRQRFGNSLHVWDDENNTKEQEILDEYGLIKQSVMADLPGLLKRALKKEDYEFLEKIKKLFDEHSI